MPDTNLPEPSSASEPAQRGEEFRGRRVAVNSMAMMAGQLGITLIGLITTPVTLSHIGLVEFGIWATISTTVAYITVIDPGFGDMITRYGAQAHLEGNRALGARLCSLFSLIWVGIGILFLPVLIWVLPIWVSHLHAVGNVPLSESLRHSTTFFFYWAYAFTVAGSIFAIVSARLTAIGDQWLVTVIDTCTRFVYGIVLLALLFNGFRLSALVIASSVQLVLTFACTLVFVVRRAGAPFGNPLRLQGGLVREVVRFGGWLQFGGLLETLTYDTDPIVISTFVSVSRTGTYNIGQRVARQSSYFASIAQSSILSAVSAAYAANEGLGAMRRMYTRANRLVVLTGGVIGGGILGMAPVIIAAWLGRFYLDADGVTCLAVIALMVALPRPATAAIVMAMGRVGLGVRAQVVAFVLNLVLTLALVGPLGMFGVLWATVIAKLAATTYLLVRFHRLVEGTARELLFSWLNKLLLAVGAGALVSRILLHFMPVSVAHERLPALLALLVLGSVYMAVVTSILRVTHYFSGEDLEWFSRILPGRLGRIAGSSLLRRALGEQP